MSDAIVVESDSAVVSFRPVAGEERSVPVGDVSQSALFLASPWRTFRWYLGQRHYSGTYWSATERDHVIYESRLELANLLLADFDSSVHHIVAQPFLLRAEVQGKLRRHIPDYLWDTEDGPVVVDVVRTERMTHPKIMLLCAWSKTVVESMGWSYLVVNEPPTIRLSNVRFLSGYRRERSINLAVLDEMRSRPGLFGGISIAAAEHSVGAYPQPLVRAALMHLLWRHEYSVDLDESLRSSTILEVPK